MTLKEAQTELIDALMNLEIALENFNDIRPIADETKLDKLFELTIDSDITDEIFKDEEDCE